MWAPFQGPITQPICYFLGGKKIIVLTAVLLLSRIQKKLPVPMNDLQRLESVALNFPI